MQGLKYLLWKVQRVCTIQITKEKPGAALEALKTNDFVYLHIEASDEAGHEGDVDLKIKTIENLDKRAVKIVYEALQTWDEPVAIAILPDHLPPVQSGLIQAGLFLLSFTNQADSGFCAALRWIRCQEGSYGELKENEFMLEFLKD